MSESPNGLRLHKVVTLFTFRPVDLTINRTAFRSLPVGPGPSRSLLRHPKTTRSTPPSGGVFFLLRPSNPGERPGFDAKTRTIVRKQLPQVPDSGV